MTQADRFDFPSLGPTGEGEPVIPYGYKPGDPHPVYWQEGVYGVTYQLDRPACAFRCHYPGGSAPCDQATANRFIEWATSRLALDEERS